jgi:hypothetical protein
MMAAVARVLACLSGHGMLVFDDMKARMAWPLGLCLLVLFETVPVYGQLDPEKRRLVQLGYNQPVEGQGPLAAYGFYYLNDPAFIRTNLALRLVLAPVYLDSELGIRHILDPNTDLGVGLGGGGFADTYSEIREGKLIKGESFTGHGFDPSLNLYHRFNPSQQIPLYGVARADFHQAYYQANSDTDPNFRVPDELSEFRVRTGVRWGGQQPLILPDLAMELSAWYEGLFRHASDRYGYADDRNINGTVHLFWARGLLAYTLPESKQQFNASLTAGTSVNTDRLSAYRVGGVLPLVSEFSLSLPGYYWQELSASSFMLLNGQYSLPLNHAKTWYALAYGGTSWMDYAPGLAQPGHWNSGVGGGIMYQSPSQAWKVVLGYGYGIDAIRSHGRGANSIGILCQFDLEAHHAQRPPEPGPRINPNILRGVDWLLGR